MTDLTSGHRYGEDYESNTNVVNRKWYDELRCASRFLIAKKNGSKDFLLNLVADMSETEMATDLRKIPLIKLWEIKKELLLVEYDNEDIRKLRKTVAKACKARGLNN